MKTVLIAVTTLDGCISRHNEPGASTWASAEDQVHFRATTSLCDVRIFGSGTYEPDRQWFVESAKPGIRKIVLTSRPEQFAADARPGILEFTSDAPEVVVARLAADGHERCAILGGGNVYGSFLRADLVDEMEITIEPLLFGNGVRLGGNVAFERRFEFVEVTNLSASTLLARYRRLST